MSEVGRTRGLRLGLGWGCRQKTPTWAAMLPGNRQVRSLVWRRHRWPRPLYSRVASLKALSASSCPASHGRCCHSRALHLLKERWQCCFLFAQQTKARYAAAQLRQCCFAMQTGQAGTLPSEPRKALAHKALIVLLSMQTIIERMSSLPYLCANSAAFPMHNKQTAAPRSSLSSP